MQIQSGRTVPFKSEIYLILLPKNISNCVPHCKENLIYVFLFWELPGLCSNFHILVPVSDLYIPHDRSTYFLQQNMQTDPGNI
jgi:hypothetical protein